MSEHQHGDRRLGDRDGRDRGSVLPLVLVMIVVGSLWVLPVLSYTTTVFKANQALSSKTQRVESVKAGLRVVLADPVALYDACNGPGDTTLAGATMTGVTVTSRCRVIGAEFAQNSAELRLGLVATQVGQSVPEELSGDPFVPADPLSPTAWSSDASVESETDKVWLPDLPVHALNLRSSDGHAMPAAYPTCTVYFPGTYTQAVTIDGPAFFTSGIYYFESELTVVGGADVVVGDGSEIGCTSDQEAAFYAENAPSTHNIGGLGATLVFGDEGRLIVDNSNGSPISMLFNRRYVAEEDTGSLPSADVSIISVNGAIDDDGVTGIDLDIPNTAYVSLSAVGGETPIAATEQDYLPSVHTPEPKIPDAPTNVSAQIFDGAVLVSWDPPEANGSSIASYTVTASSLDTCTTQGATSCVVTGLPNDSAVGFTVTATNEVGESDLSAESSPVTPRWWETTLAAPTAPAPPSATAYDGSAVVTWTAASTNGAPVTGYTVRAYDESGALTAETCSVEANLAAAPPLECTMSNLANGQDYTFDVFATNAIGDSAPSAPSSDVEPESSLGDPPPPAPPAADPFYAPPALVDLDVAGAAAVTVDIPGYISVPQGRIHIDNPNSHDVEIIGGILAAQFDVTDGRAAGPQSVDVGFVPLVVQRKIRIVTTNNAGAETSTAIVQINQNGAYAINSWQVQ